MGTILTSFLNQISVLLAQEAAVETAEDKTIEYVIYVIFGLLVVYSIIKVIMSVVKAKKEDKNGKD
jgi:hypothetical protein